ncbi:Flp pilus assembly protein TadD [Acidovorax sp. CF316]|uniref:FecR domain-containing protein n=1 Tax=Acidovorax sp. CF316 TaxID=1144317 RepID=UPI00026BEA07|nr:FecR domain-containing protein [Acidovorax sp. CF316]EJE51464.1 Flp pilus assembly protein TadD [Acidovorax sp. CF316]
MPSTHLWIKTPIALAATLCLPSAWAQCAGVSVAPDTVAAQIVALAGQGQTRPPGEGPWSPAVLAQQLGAGAGVRTLELSSAALLLADRTQIRMSANAQLRLCESQPERSLLELAAGRLWARTKKTPASLQLQTPAALAVVRGTDWDVEVDAAGRTTLTVLSGQVDLSNAFGRVELGPAEQGYVEPGKAPVKRLLVRPRERVQWVMANPVDATRWVELQGDAVAPPLAALRDDLRTGQWPRARERLLALSASGQGGAVVELLLADLDVFDDRMDAAQQRLAAAWQRTQDPRTAARRAGLLMALDQSPEARAWLDTARTQAPEATALLLADADWQRLEGRGEEAIALYRRAVAGAEARREPATDQAAAQWGLGRALRERGDLRGAREALARAVALSPAQPAYQGEQATLAAEALRLGDARTGFDAALAQAGDDYVSLAGAGLLALQQGDPGAARSQLLKALVIEPRYARAQVWLAVAEYQLGEQAAALDSLARARVADPNDPLPWQIESTLHNDSGQPVQAIAAAREALVRLPFLKSLNPLASDSRGSASLGKALGDFGMEHWARAYAAASYYPLWAGSHFFLSDRYESDFNRRSELFQGYLTDPTVFGASEKRAPLLLSTGSEWSAGASAERNPLRHNATVDAGHRGFATAPIPVAWLVRGQDIQMWPREGPAASRYRLSSPDLAIAVGAKPSESLSLFLQHTDSTLRYRFPDGRDFGNGITFTGGAETRARRTDAGGSWRWSADSQTWIQVHGGRQTSGLVLDDARFGPQDYHYASEEKGLFLRHTLLQGPHRFSAGWERVTRDTDSAIADAQVVSPRANTERYDMPWMAGEWRSGPWSVMAEAYWPRLSTAQSDRFTDTAGQDLLDPQFDGAARRRKLLPRVGASVRLGPGRALHWAWQESMRAPGTHTLAPVSTGAIAVDNQYLLPGSLARKHALQLDWELGPSTFLGASLSGQRIHNLVARDGRLFAMNTAALFDNINTVAPVVLSAQTSLNTYEETPVFGQGHLVQSTVSVNHLLGPRWSVLGSYIHTDSRNTGEGFSGNLLPGFARHVALGQTTWRHEGRGFSLLRLTWRGMRYRDEANFLQRPPGWSMALAHGWESQDRRFTLVGSLETGLRSGERPTLWALLRYRD